MPLSDALKARLAKRGLIQRGQLDDEVVEEVIAEDYSGDHHNFGRKDEPDSVAMRWMPKCPNKSNPHHSCVEYCEKRYGLAPFSGFNNTDTERRRLRMLRHYPLPDGWKEIADPETNRYYYCNPSTGQSSWLSPAHPKARVYSASGQKLQERISSSARHRNRERDRRPSSSHRRYSDDDDDRNYKSRRDRSPVDRDRR